MRLKSKIPNSSELFFRLTKYGESHLLWGEEDITVIWTLTAWHLSNLGGIGQSLKVTYRGETLDNNITVTTTE